MSNDSPMEQINPMPFAELPLDKNGPHGNAWGRWGPDDQLGTLNYLTEEVVAKAARDCIKTGQRVSLNWSLEGPKYPRFARKTLSINTINKAPEKHAHDDEWSFNSQCSSQWDGFRHYAYQKEALYYMGRTAEDFAKSPEPNGVQHVAKNGIAGRAMFVDWYAWALEQGKNVDATTSYAVPFSEILEALGRQGMSVGDFNKGDILVIRFGYLRQYADMDDDKRARLNEHYKTHKPDNIGIQPSEDLLKFLWNSQIATVAGDSRSFEVWPCSQLQWHLHEWLLAELARRWSERLIPVMAFLYLLSHIDRGNVGNAKIEGMDKDLGLVGNQYNIISTIFFVPYIIFEIPSNAIIKKIRPSYWLTALIICWGICMTCMGVVNNFREILACRVLLGFFEAGFFPGAVFLVSSWYPRYELQQRLAIFYTASAFSGALSGLLAFAIAKMDGLRGIEGWRWIFLIEGAITVATGVIMPFLIPDTPERASWLTADEKRFIDLRLRQSGVRTSTEEGDKFSWKLLGKTMIDWKILLGILMAWANSVPNAAFKFTMPQIINQLGFSTTQSQLLTIPPYFCGGVSAWLVGRFADKFKWRMPFIAGPLVVVAVALGVLLGLSSDIAGNVGPMYFAIVLAQIGIYPLLPGITAWTGNNLGTSWKRSLGLAWLLAAGNIGSIVGTNIFIDSEGPSYSTGYGVSFGIICLGLICASTLEFVLWRLNRTKSKLSEAEVRETYSPVELDRMGEKSPLFKYTL